MDLYTILQQNAAECIFFSSACGTFSRVDHMLGQKKSLSAFQRFKNHIKHLSDLNGMKLEINYRKKAGKNHKYDHIILAILFKDLA